MSGPGDSTRTVAAVAAEAVPGTPMQMGPVLAAPYHLSEDEGSEPHTYARASNPGWTGLESALAELEGVSHALVTGSGMSAITVVLRSVLSAGDVLVVPSDGYYQVRLYARERLARWGIEIREASVHEMVDAAVGAAVVIAETPSNPTLDTVDLAAVAAATTGLLVVDNTTATPLGQNPVALGADVVVASGTKALSGHSDLLAGYIGTNDADLHTAFARERLLSGSVLGPFETWLAHRSLGTAGLRFGRQCENALAVAESLSGTSTVSGVRYPGLPADPSFAVASAQMRRFGGLVSFDLGSARAVHEFVKKSELISAATSFGGIHTTADRRQRWGDPVPDGFVRLSCGIEDTVDLVADIERALN
nr:cystathionine gamma-lyase [Rhodococcus trifolii]